ncbi:MAG: hypothetical protein ACLTXR_03100 [Clostridia bacterium]
MIGRVIPVTLDEIKIVAELARWICCKMKELRFQRWCSDKIT